MAKAHAPQTRTQPDYPRGVTFEQVWAALMENREQLRENAEQQKETDRIVKGVVKRQEETDRILKENAERQKEEAKQHKEEADRIQKEEAKRQKEEAAKRKEEFDRANKEAIERHKELDRIVKENAKLIGGLGDRYGEMIEFMVKPNLVSKFRELGFEFTKVHQGTNIKDKENDIFAQVDLTLEDGDKVMIVEVKSKPSMRDIKDHVTRMEKLRRHADLHDDKRKYLGAVAGMVIKDNARAFILKNGFYAIEPSGETFIITPPEDDKPKEW